MSNQVFQVNYIKQLYLQYVNEESLKICAGKRTLKKSKALEKWTKILELKNTINITKCK